MGEIIYEKLVRDKIPSIIEADSQTPVIRTLGDADFIKALLEKLVEEAIELRDSGGDIGERVDVAEVLCALDEALALRPETIERERAAKAERRGGFSKKIFLEKAITND